MEATLFEALFNIKNNDNIQNCITDATGKAKVYIAKGDVIRKMYQLGCHNSSLKSTTRNTLANAELMARGFSERDNYHQITFFGEHISQAIQTIKSFFKK